MSSFGDFDGTPGSIATVNGEQATVLIADAGSAEDLDGLERDERASQRHPGGRKGVLREIEERRQAIVSRANASRVYSMTGTQGLRLPGLTIAPGAGDFEASLDPVQEEFLVRIGAIRVKG